MLWRVTMPRSERMRVMKYLDQFNLNAFSLFGTEDALAETTALRVFRY